MGTNSVGTNIVGTNSIGTDIPTMFYISSALYLLTLYLTFKELSEPLLVPTVWVLTVSVRTLSYIKTAVIFNLQ